ncbi:MAG: DUF4363 family protein [Firmicutes bacterium]|nr:DUF4363 family protein [Bacillota bacterium]
MKFLIFTAVLLLLLFGGCLLAVEYIQISAERIELHFDGLEEAIDAEDWERALEIFSHCEREWERVSSRWKAMINHEDMRDIEISFVDLRAVLEQQELNRAQQEMATLRYYMRHVPDNERVRLTNVL